MCYFSPTPTGQPPPAACQQPPPATTLPPPENFSGGLFPANPKCLLVARSTRSTMSRSLTRHHHHCRHHHYHHRCHHHVSHPTTTTLTPLRRCPAATSHHLLAAAAHTTATTELPPLPRCHHLAATSTPHLAASCCHSTTNYHPSRKWVILLRHAFLGCYTHIDGKEHDDDIQKSVSPDIHSSSCGDQTRKQGDKAENKDKGKSPVVTITRFRDLNEEFEKYINNSSNGVNVVGSLVFATELNFTNSTNDFSATGPSNAAMPNWEDLSHNADDVGAEADINNMESIISVSPIPTTRIHKDHLTSQIIGDLSSTTQTRSMPRAVRDQGRISQMFNEDFHTCMFACFLSQEEPKRVHQALKDPSWIEAMQEELLQFKMQKV
nr:hypothetical protein [Tanacetum cinerariifolium]